MIKKNIISQFQYELKGLATVLSEAEDATANEVSIAYIL
jgi:hypothetical protein